MIFEPSPAFLATPLSTHGPILETLRGLDTGEEPNTVVTLGGDGALLNALHKHGLDKLYVPLNYGTMGYLPNRSMSPETFVQKVQADGIQWHKFPVLGIEGTAYLNLPFAFNEFAIMGHSGQATKMYVSVDGNRLTREPVTSTGICISTAQGTTGFASTLGASCLVPGIPAMAITWISPYKPRPLPMVVHLGAVVEVEILDAEWRPAVIHYDGRITPILPTDRVTVRVRPDAHAILGYLPDHDFTRRMIGKIIR